MLQIDHVYEFLYQELFKDFDLWYLRDGIVNTGDINYSDITIFTRGRDTELKIFFYDQEPFIEVFATAYMKMYNWVDYYSWKENIELFKANQLPYRIPADPDNYDFYLNNYQCIYKKGVLATSEHSDAIDQCIKESNLKKLYYFFHGFAALDWYRGYYALNYNKPIVKQYNRDFISFNRIITDDRSYRIYFVSLLKELGLLDHGLVSFNVTDNQFDDWRDEVVNVNSKLSQTAKLHIEENLTDINRLIIDSPELPGSASASIPRNIDSWIYPINSKPLDVDSFWHVVTETVFYYNKLHLTEKIFKPIVSKQAFMLLAAPGNLAYLKSYGFKTFDSVIDETYDLIQDPDLRTEAVVRQLHWYCNLTPDEKTDIIRQLEPIIDYNFHHFYGEFPHIITRELLDNTKTVFQELGYNDQNIDYDNLYHFLTKT